MTELFWLISKEARRDLEEYQWENHKEEKPFLDLHKAKAPWEIKPPVPEIPTEDMTDQEIQDEMVKPPSHQARVK